ncbi:MAG: tryptophan synthase subunit alpha [Verrucomicrobia bacterium]|nr:tryptophan synthase subunit alpha [Verrucomicrobiota bacterium]MBV9673925.1 tryptophan synthase subunit alpha [Verrucomicrobiota bacterium]
MNASIQNRIDTTFTALRERKEKAFMAYITGGDPDLPRTVHIALALARSGVDFLEIGIPFSDPLADGVANQLGAQRALAAGATVPKLLTVIHQIREQSPIPIILYSYLNPIFQFGFSRFQDEALSAGADGLLLLDLPPDEKLLPDRTQKLHRIRLVAPTTSEVRLSRIVADASGFIYYVSREGVTGERTDISATIAENVATIRKYTSLPIAVGFGISNPEQALKIAQMADAVVVGSAIVRRIGEFGEAPDLIERLDRLVRPLVTAVKSAPELTVHA